MMAVFVVIHIIICILLIIVILIQAGRGGGLVEGFSNVESMFGPKTNMFLARVTTTLAVLFFISCVGLALMSAHRSRSLMRNVKAQAQPAADTKQAVPAVKQEAPVAPETAVPVVNQTTADAPKPQ